MKLTNPTDDPPTVIWGEDFVKLHPSMVAALVPGTRFHIILITTPDGSEYELGLRSDGVVVWRKLK